MIARHVHLSDAAAGHLARAYATGALSARGRHRVLRVARTVADLAGHERVSGEDMELALVLRGDGRPQEEAAA